MFESAELHTSIPKEEYNEKLPILRLKLFQLQQDLHEAKVPVLIVIDGVQGAGRGATVNLLNEWMDSRSIRNRSFWRTTDEEHVRPEYWRYWRILPRKGEIGIFFGAWYERIMQRTIKGKIKDPDKALQEAKLFENTLAADGTLIIKLWLHLSKDDQSKIDPKLDHFQNKVIAKTSYDKLLGYYSKAIRITDSANARWYLINCHNAHFRNIFVLETLINAMQTALDSHTAAKSAEQQTPHEQSKFSTVSILDSCDLTKKLDKKDYKTMLEECQAELSDLTLKAFTKGISTVAMFEGWDAAGKGSSIRRVTSAIDARLRQTIQTAAPTDEELARHYLWRFWRNIPAAGFVTIYDRSWYGRVLVERVENLITPDVWERAYEEINSFESQLVENNCVLVKFWLQISSDEQLNRFKQREESPLKRWKITSDDWRNREKAPEYRVAIDEMLRRTSTDIAPWSVIPAEDKYYARVEIIKTICEKLRKVLHNPDGY